MSKVVLDEDVYVGALERIIERDFFPDLPALRKQTQRVSGDDDVPATGAVQSTAPRTHDTAGYSMVVRDNRGATNRSDSSSWDHPTPVRTPTDEEQQGHEVDLEHTRDEPEPREAIADMPLNKFVATHTSEDNAAFTELQHKAIEDHKRRYHWAYDIDETKGDPKLHLLTNGEWISKDQRRLVEEVLAPKGPKDDRPSAPDTWPFRARNPLLFPPELEVTKRVSQTTTSSTDTQALIEHDGSATRAIVKRAVQSRKKTETIYANSRFPSQNTISTKDDDSQSSATSNRLDLVQMTPMIAPGVDASPLMTWGEIEGTPLILNARVNPDQVLGGPSFQMKETSSREKIAHRLESEARARKSQSRQRTPTPLVSHGKRSSSELATPSRTTSLRSRLSSVRSIQRTPIFGTDSELRASYSTPLLPPRSTRRKV